MTWPFTFRGPAYGLYERGLGPEEALLVRVQYGHQRHFGKVQALSQQVDAHEGIEDA